MAEKLVTMDAPPDYAPEIAPTGGGSAKSRPYELVAHSLDGTHTHRVRLASGTDCVQCNCGSPLFTIMFAEFSDHSDGVIAQCQECGQLLEIQKD